MSIAQWPAARSVPWPAPRPELAPILPCADPSSESAAVEGRVDALVHDLIGRVADKWTMLVLEVLGEHGTVRFTRLGTLVGGVSPKMLTQTLRQMERDGLVTRTVHPVVPPRVEYALTPLGFSLGAAFCGVWIWAEEHLRTVEAARTAFDARVVGPPAAL